MAPKPVVPVKGQSSLTSFFSKGPGASASAPPKVAAITPAPNPIKESINAHAQQQNNGSITTAAAVSNGNSTPYPNVTKSVVAPVTASSFASSKAEDKDASKTKRSRRVIDDDEEEAQFDESSAKPMPDSKGKLYIHLVLLR